MRYSTEPTSKGRPWLRILGLAAVGIAGAGAVVAYPILFPAEPPPGPKVVEIEFEKPRKQPASKEENREIVSSQHVQVKKSWENPGVYAWGSNTGKVAAPDSNETVVKSPRRIPYFDGQILRDLKLDRNFGAAVTEQGDLVQWGTGFDKDDPKPAVTLAGKDLVKVSLSSDRIIGLSSSGSVYSIPVARSDQESGEKETGGSSWLPFWSGLAPISYRTLKPDLKVGEKVTDIKSGLEHCLLLTSKGRVFTAASSSEGYPARGQLGVPGVTWATRPSGPYDEPLEVPALKGFRVKEIAAGDYHSMVLDKEGRVFGFGDNSTGQLGLEPQLDAPFVDAPSLVPVNTLYRGTGQTPRVTSIAAGGSNSFFTVDASKNPAADNTANTNNAANTDSAGNTDITRAGNTAPIQADTWACGEGIHGSLGTGRWTHVSQEPTKIKALSNLREFDEKTNKVVPIRLASLSVGSSHAAAVMDNVTRTVSARGGNGGSENDTNYGADVLWWGGNEHYQLGTGKRNNVANPTYIAPLDERAGRGRKEGKEEDVHRFQIAPRTTVRIGEGGQGRKADVEQRVECGRFVSAVYSAA
ncbi:RCC1/BLIP-II protein [Coniochaeta ligniaria NRRL 30616]|uniref:RCC1/BLIP-II protein n=1 Tax=Coniochaeta ligniaria NRRL 30616 TaxID=1408157 RepID=A0A1J7IFN1_9PEZI|nr:RCC1/BLIP-II protein [Coniochaeta ligniaria NRRL 30616]